MTSLEVVSEYKLVPYFLRTQAECNCRYREVLGTGETMIMTRLLTFCITARLKNRTEETEVLLLCVVSHFNLGPQPHRPQSLSIAREILAAESV